MNLVVLSIIVFLTTVNANPLIQLKCTNNNQPSFSNETYCSSEGDKVYTCCNKIDQEKLLDVTELFSNVHNKFESLKSSFNSAIHLIDGLHCVGLNESLVLSTESGLKKLSLVNWTDFIHSVTQQCKQKLFKAHHCANHLTCGMTGSEIKPCRGYCTNIIRGCFHSLSENLQTPWKHAVNSVRTALRLIHTQQSCIGLPSVGKEFEFLTSNMNAWREPLQWIENICEFNANHDNCFNGDFINGNPNTESGYRKTISPWSSQSNPEFKTNSELDHHNDALLAKQRDDLIAVSKSLERYWPSLGPINESSQQSDEAIDYLENSSSEEEYENYSDGDSGSGSGRINFETDDEDLINGYYGNNNEGSGSHNIDSELNIIDTTTTTTKTIQSSSTKLIYNHFLLIFLFAFWF